MGKVTYFLPPVYEDSGIKIEPIPLSPVSSEFVRCMEMMDKLRGKLLETGISCFGIPSNEVDALYREVL